MRRADREVTEPQIIADIIEKCNCCRIGFCDEGKVYIVPLSYGYELTDTGYAFYFHSAREGRKINLIQESPEVGFELDTNYRVHEAETACKHSAAFQSIIGNGTVHMLDEMEAKKHALSLIMEHSTGKREWEFEEQMVSAVAVFRLTVTEMSCKIHR